jgi:hypothetical protein
MKEEITLITLDAKANAYAEAHSDLAAQVRTLNAAIDDLKRRHLPIIKHRVARAAEAHDALKRDIALAPHLFVKPRTIVLRGIKIGYQKATGELIWDDEAQVIARIKKHFPDQVDLLIRTKENANKPALSELPAGDLKRLGVEISDTGDKVVIKPTDNGVEKLVKQLLNNACEAEPE